ncbi:hypothetical protein M8J77_003831 [Diaphorina citri]|nr:hypothetical protein M8J77_003831 [Diaphorina citri]
MSFPNESVVPLLKSIVPHYDLDSNRYSSPTSGNEVHHTNHIYYRLQSLGHYTPESPQTSGLKGQTRGVKHQIAAVRGLSVPFSEHNQVIFYFILLRLVLLSSYDHHQVLKRSENYSCWFGSWELHLIHLFRSAE